MQALKDRIRNEGKILPGSIVKVDGFLNHRVDCAFMGQLADEFARIFDLSQVDVVLTAEASGIALASICAFKWGKPMIFAKKAKSDNIEGGLYKSEIMSYTYNKKVTLYEIYRYAYDQAYRWAGQYAKYYGPNNEVLFRR